MNALNKNIEEGATVMLTDGQIVTVIGGFGMCAETTGTALFVESATGNKFRVSGMQVREIL